MQYPSRKIGIALAIMAALGAAAFLLFSNTASPVHRTLTLDLRELNVRITVPENLTDLGYETRQGPDGSVLLMRAASIPSSSGIGCQLGTFLLINKNSVPQAGRWTIDALRAAEDAHDGVPPQVKEFPDSYLVFEASQSVCTTDSSKTKLEADKRTALWSTVATAVQIDPAPLIAVDQTPATTTEQVASTTATTSSATTTP